MTQPVKNQRWIGHADLDAFYASIEKRVILRKAWELFLHGNLPRKPVRLIGVGISDWHQDEPVQADLFEQPQTDKKDDKLLETLDRITDRFGKGILQIGAINKTGKHKSE